MGALQRLGEAAQGARAPWSQVQSLAGGQGGPPRSLLAHLPSRCQRPGLSSGLGTANGGLISGRVGVEEMPHVVPVTPLVPPRHPVGLGPPAAGKRGLGSRTEYPGLSDWLPGTLGSCPSGGSVGRQIPFLPLAAPSLSSCLEALLPQPGKRGSFVGKGELWPGNSQVCTEITLASKKNMEY